VWAYAEHISSVGLNDHAVANVVSLSGGALLANVGLSCSSS
jgi:ADP-dependent phosphofructokinase/glucokinase